MTDDRIRQPALAGWFFRPNLSGGLKRADSGEKSTGVDDLPPIVLGIIPNGTRTTRFTLSVIRPVHRWFGSCSKCLLIKAFDGYENTSRNWVLSIISLSGAFNGTTRTYLDFGWHAWQKNYYNFGFDHFNLSRSKTGIWGLVNCLLGKTCPFASDDWILPDLTIQGSIRLNAYIQTFSDTYYFSYATKRTRNVMGATIPSGLLSTHFLLLVRVLQMSQWRYPPDVEPPYKVYHQAHNLFNSKTSAAGPGKYGETVIVRSDCVDFLGAVWKIS
ncbi:alpha/beta-Hydrolases superfamily protein [Striga hermonthica]|uniref:Alpha/beta-Hydrolases superfamily protein n=1 Tax=Striga hermonthica TaxID=68872 RepID=A0A9N7RJG5_STRHE|nr:alpha/beta-Hydrolases superfamily protein [Striga hermonthica]